MLKLFSYNKSILS